MKVKVTQSCLTLCDPVDYSVHGILQARILKWVAFPFSSGSSQPRDRTQVSHIAGRFFTSWATREAQECWSGQPIPSPTDPPGTGVKLWSSCIAGGFFTNWDTVFLKSTEKNLEFTPFRSWASFVICVFSLLPLLFHYKWCFSKKIWFLIFCN